MNTTQPVSELANRQLAEERHRSIAMHLAIAATVTYVFAMTFFRLGEGFDTTWLTTAVLFGVIAVLLWQRADDHELVRRRLLRRCRQARRRLSAARDTASP